MARPSFKKWITRFIPTAAERSTFVLASSLALAALMLFWQPMGGLIWNVEAQWLRCSLWSVFALGWTLVLASTFLLNHFDLFGLRQIWLNFRNKPYQQLHFSMPWVYKLIRHPLYLGFLLALWATPTMTIAHLVLAGALTTYIFIGIRLEEKDLIDAHPEYADYRKEVPMVVPFTGKSAPAGLGKKSPA
jgi:protein-S-isoprenylcysteine O-methyltransferase Ste14